jgi:hypothetical protein
MPAKSDLVPKFITYNIPWISNLDLKIYFIIYDVKRKLWVIPSYMSWCRRLIYLGGIFYVNLDTQVD